MALRRKLLNSSHGWAAGSGHSTLRNTAMGGGGKGGTTGPSWHGIAGGQI